MNMNDCQADISDARASWQPTSSLENYIDNRVDYINAIQYKDIGKGLEIPSKKDVLNVGSHHLEILHRSYAGRQTSVLLIQFTLLQLIDICLNVITS